MSVKKEKLANIPNKPGTYLFKDKTGRILYIGKAKNLKKRVKSYFQKKPNLPENKPKMLKQAINIELGI